MITNLLADLRLAARSFAKQPAFAVLAILTLALGIGATAAMFSVMEGVLLSPTPYPQSERVMLVGTARLDGKQIGNNVSTAHWLELQKASSFTAVAGYDWTFGFLMAADRSDSVQGMIITPEYFAVTGLKPLLGRGFTAQDSAARGSPADKIILGYRRIEREFCRA